MHTLSSAPVRPCDVSRRPFGALPDGRQASLYTLANHNGMQVMVTNYGGIITQLLVPDRHGQPGNVVLGHATLEPYLNDQAYLGALIGRHANRIGHGRFTLEGQAWQLDVNNGANHLHGGAAGFHTRLWEARMFRDDDAAGVTLSLCSPHGDQGYPGNLLVTVRYALRADNVLAVSYGAVCDRATPVNLTQHSYFNLAGQGDILDHQLTIDADAYTPVDAALIPLGRHDAVAGTPFDFRQPRAIGARIGAPDEQLQRGGGYDHNVVLNPGAAGARQAAVRLHEPASGRVMELFTTEPGLQFYSGNFLGGQPGGAGRSFGYRSGLCLEPQHFPDAPNQPAFPGTILLPGEQYRSASSYVFSVSG